MTAVFEYATISATLPPQINRAAFSKLITRAAREWNQAMTGLAYFQPAAKNARVFFRFGTVDRSTSPTRVAQCDEETVTTVVNGRATTRRRWTITLAADQRWDVNGWQRFWGRGLDVLPTLVHELGHVLLPPHWHSARSGDVMHADLLNHLISADERSLYRGMWMASPKH